MVGKKQELLSLRDIFLSHDADDDGFITLEEMEAECSRQHQQNCADAKRRGWKYSTYTDRSRAEDQAAFSASLAQALFKALDRNRDGKITFKEAVQFIYPKACDSEVDAMVRWAYPDKPKDEGRKGPSTEQEAEIRAIFRLFDKDGSGGLDRRELASALQSGFGLCEIEEMHREFDLDCSGAIELGEFRALMLASGIYGPDLRGD